MHKTQNKKADKLTNMELMTADVTQENLTPMLEEIPTKAERKIKEYMCVVHTGRDALGRNAYVAVNEILGMSTHVYINT